MDHAEEGRDARDDEEDPGRPQPAVDDRRQRPSPENRGQDEPIAEEEERLVAERDLTAEGRRRGAQRREERSRFDQHDGGRYRHERERDRGAVPLRGREESLSRDLEPDEDQDGRDRRLGQYRD